MSIELRLYNTLTRKKEVFKPEKPGKAIVYVCGVTPYAYSHIGHGRSYVNFDVLIRILRFFNFETTYIRNITDIDDKLLKKATEADQPKSYIEIAETFINDYHTQMDRLNTLKPNFEPRATQNIPAMIALVETLLSKNHAYHLENDIYFDISTFSEYGKLSGKNPDDLEEGARVQTRKGKKKPGDFVLWKGNDSKDFWETPWGYGRPGWHIECSAMIHAICKSTIDIHGGGDDLIFPHHENEIAQSEAAFGYPLANYWIHNALLNLKKAKMSKSTGNTLSLKDILEKFDPATLRYYFLQHSYQTPIEFSSDEMASSSKSLAKLSNIFENVATTDEYSTLKDLDISSPYLKEIIESLADNLNVPKALGLIFKYSSQIKESQELAQSISEILTHTLGININTKNAEIEQKSLEESDEIKKLIEQREEARKRGDWSTADSIRNKLNKMNVQLHDKKS